MHLVNVSRKYYRVNPRDICFIRYVFEAHDGLAVISTLSDERDTIVLRIAPGCEDEVETVLDGLKRELSIDERNMDMSGTHGTDHEL